MERPSSPSGTGLPARVSACRANRRMPVANEPASTQPLSAEDVRAVARLARLDISEDRVQQLRAELGAVLAYMDRLREVDVSGVEPMTHPNDAGARLDADEPRGASEDLSTEAFMA